MNNTASSKQDISLQNVDSKGTGNAFPVPSRLNVVPRVRLSERLQAPYDLLRIYLHDIKQYQLLTREEERELATRIRDKKDERAAHRLITSNLRLVVKIAMNFHRYWTKNLLDLIQEGNLGLLRAVRKFDPCRSTKFSYYASFWIKASMLKFIMDNWKLVRIGTTQNQRKLFFNLAKARKTLVAQGLHPDPSLLAARLDVKEKDVVEMSYRLQAPEYSLSSPVIDDSRESYGAILPDPTMGADEQLSDNQNRQALSKKLKTFRKTIHGKDADIFDNRILAENPMTLRELGAKHHMSRERVRQIQTRIIVDVKDWLRREIPNFEEEYPSLLK